MTATETQIPPTRARATKLAAQYRSYTSDLFRVGLDANAHERSLARLSRLQQTIRREDSSLSTWLLCERCDYSELTRAVRDGKAPADVAPLMVKWTEAYERTQRHIESLEV